MAGARSYTRCSRSFGAPLPLDPASGPDVPTAAQLTSLLNSLADPNASRLRTRAVWSRAASGAPRRDARPQARRPPSTGSAVVVQRDEHPAGGRRLATADVPVSVRSLSPVTQNVTFVNRGWMLSRASAMGLLQAAGIRLAGRSPVQLRRPPGDASMSNTRACSTVAQGRTHRPVQAVLEIGGASPLHRVRGKVTVKRGVLWPAGGPARAPCRGDQLVEP